MYAFSIIIKYYTSFYQLLGDFNVELLKYDQYSTPNEFLESLSSRMLLSNILQPTRKRNIFKTVIGTNYSNVSTPNTISRILLPHYLTISHSFLLLLTFSQIHPIQNQISLKENGPSLIKKTLILTNYL